MTGETAAAYSGWCARCGVTHRLPRSPQATAAARHWLTEYEATSHERGAGGKMLGVLVGTLPDGEAVTLRAVSGLHGDRPGVAAPTRDILRTAAAERATLARLSAISAEIERLAIGAARRAVDTVREPLDREVARLVAARRRNKKRRADERRGLVPDAPSAARLQELLRESQHETLTIRELRRRRQDELRPLLDDLERRLARRRELRAARRGLSAQLQSAFHTAHGFVNFAGHHASLAELFAGLGGIPSGAGECCAPKLLQEAARRQIRPSGVAEIWCGPSSVDGARRHAAFYDPCETRCLPLLGHLLCGADAPRPALLVLYEDEHVIAVDKPAGLLAVPGRGAAGRDSAQSRIDRIEYRRCGGAAPRAAHRLDQATSGVLLFARDRHSYAALAAAFRSGLARKEYIATVGGTISADRGAVDLPIGFDYAARPRRRIDLVAGKPARTEFEVLARRGNQTTLRLRPATGRTHQLRLHCAAGLGAPIVGDTLYGGAAAPRLMLHAWRIELPQPATGATLAIEAPAPF